MSTVPSPTGPRFRKAHAMKAKLIIGDQMLEVHDVKIKGRPPAVRRSWCLACNAMVQSAYIIETCPRCGFVLSSTPPVAISAIECARLVETDPYLPIVMDAKKREAKQT